jgi:LytS/YehU family sensor histidine kinase
MGHAMMLSPTVALFLVATLGADAALQAKSKKKAKADKFVQAVTISGECVKLVHAGHSVGGCENILVNMNYSTGVSAYWFISNRTILSFAGDGSHRIEQGSDIVIQSIERVILATKANNSKRDDTKEDAAVGFCRFGDPTRKGMMVECMAHTQVGLYEGTFVADGNPPKLEKFQISR